MFESIKIYQNEEIDIEALSAGLVEYGYRACRKVSEEGDFSRLGRLRGSGRLGRGWAGASGGRCLAGQVGQLLVGFHEAGVVGPQFVDYPVKLGDFHGLGRRSGGGRSGGG